MPKVVHCRKEPYDILIDRTTEYGNPFKIGSDGTRKECIEKFRLYLSKNKELQEKAKENLKGKVLGCWCKPKMCHGDVYIEFLEGLDV